MKTRRIIAVFFAMILALSLVSSTALAAAYCDCGTKHTIYSKTNPENNPTLVKKAQTQLKALGYKFTAKTGVVTSSMRNALKSFQYDAALKTSRQLTNCTLYRLEKRSAAVKTNRNNKKWTNLFKGDYRLLEKNMSGSRVATLNSKLIELGYPAEKGSSRYTAKTVYAVKLFQMKYVKNRPADGKAGPYTLSTLEKIYGQKKK